VKRIRLPGGYSTLIDNDDEELVAGFRWRVLQLPKLYYVHAWHGQLHIYMHRLIIGAPDRKHVDHVNGDGLDNRRLNLRIATPSQNHANRSADNRISGKTSRFKGVYFDRGREKWGATIHVNGKTQGLGRYDAEEAAAAAYDLAAVKAWGEFARTNLPQP
jgi:hypothetical protein